LMARTPAGRRARPSRSADASGDSVDTAAE
jgi:hypothetical protein